MQIALLELTFHRDKLDEARTVMDRTLAQTTAFEGCLGVEVLVAADDVARWLIVERWASKEADDAYRAFRATPEGAIAELPQLLAGRPTLTFFTTQA